MIDPDARKPMPEDNAYAPPTEKPQAVAVDASGFEALRRACIAKESSIKSVGLLGILGGILYGVGGLVMSRTLPEGRMLLLLGLFGGFSAFSLLVGFGLRALQPWARLLFTGLCALSTVLQLIGMAQSARPGEAGGKMAGLAIMLAFLAVLWTHPSATVFSLRYRREVIPATPHIRYRTPTWLWILLGVIVLAVVLVVVGAALHR